MSTEPGFLDQRSLRVLADVSTYLASGLGSEELLAGVAAALGRGLQSGECCVWIRTADGTGFRAVVGDGCARPPAERATSVQKWVQESAAYEPGDGRWFVRIPLVHEGAPLGLLEASIPDSPDAPMLRQVVSIVANVLSPLLAAQELSEDLASEVALRTREIEAQRRFTSKIIDSLPVGLYVIDRDYHIQAWNRIRETGAQGIERDDALGKPVFDVLDRLPKETLRKEFDSVFNTGRIEQVEVRSSTSGTPRFYRITKVPMRVDDDEVTHVITIGEDLTEQKMAQQQVTHTEKLAAVGQLAAGVMHEINNPLATIGACVEALGLRRDELPEHLRQGIDEYLRIIESELARCDSIVNGLLDFSRPKGRAKREAQINQVVEDALFLVRHHDRFKGITLHHLPAEGVPSIMVNTEQFIQVFLALMLNAIDAMEGKGQLTVRAFRNPERADEVVVSIADTGAGIAGEDIPKIFEPFFTTKQPGRGTGLGLSICYGIVQEHGGRISVESQVGYGSEFRVYLPIRQAEVA